MSSCHVAERALRLSILMYCRTSTPAFQGVLYGEALFFSARFARYPMDQSGNPAPPVPNNIDKKKRCPDHHGVHALSRSASSAFGRRLCIVRTRCPLELVPALDHGRNGWCGAGKPILCAPPAVSTARNIRKRCKAQKLWANSRCHCFRWKRKVHRVN